MPNIANDTQVATAVPSLRFKDTLHVMDTGAVGCTRVLNIEIDIDVLRWSVVRNKTRFGDTLDARLSCSMVLICAKWFMFDRPKVCWGMNIVEWLR